MIRFWCECGRQLQARENMIGQPASCPLCRQVSVVPPTDQDKPRAWADKVRTVTEEPSRPRINEYAEIKRPSPDRPRRPEPVQRPASTLASLSVTLGVLSFPCMLGLLTAIPAIITGILALCDRRVRSGERTGKARAVGGIVLGCIGVVVLLPFFWATGTVRVAAARMKEANNLKMIGLCLHDYESTYGSLPAAATYRTRDDKPGLSWRVAILPFIESSPLYKKFKLDEPWDSPNNLALLSEMPTIYLQPGQPDDGKGLTHYQVFVGPGTAFEDANKPNGINPFVFAGIPRNGLKLADMRDGTSNTIMVAVAKNPVPWTKPDDLNYDPNLPLPPLDERFGGFQFLFCDGSVRCIPKNTPTATLRAMITRNGGEIINWP